MTRRCSMCGGEMRSDDSGVWECDCGESTLTAAIRFLDATQHESRHLALKKAMYHVITAAMRGEDVVGIAEAALIADDMREERDA